MQQELDEVIQWAAKERDEIRQSRNDAILHVEFERRVNDRFKGLLDNAFAKIAQDGWSDSMWDILQNIIDDRKKALAVW